MKKLGVSFEHLVARLSVLVFNDKNLILIVMKNVKMFNH